MRHEQEFITSSDSTIVSSLSTSDERLGHRRNMNTQFEYDRESFESTKKNKFSKHKDQEVDEHIFRDVRDVIGTTEWELCFIEASRKFSESESAWCCGHEWESEDKDQHVKEL